MIERYTRPEAVALWTHEARLRRQFSEIFRRGFERKQVRSARFQTENSEHLATDAEQ